MCSLSLMYFIFDNLRHLTIFLNYYSLFEIYSSYVKTYRGSKTSSMIVTVVNNRIFVLFVRHLEQFFC